MASDGSRESLTEIEMPLCEAVGNGAPFSRILRESGTPGDTYMYE